MNIRHKYQVKWLSILLCILSLTLFLVACSNGQGTGNSAPAVTPTSTPKPTPTPTPTGSTYTGTTFTLIYPQGWTETDQSATSVNEFSFQPSGAGAGPNNSKGLLVTVSRQTPSADPEAGLNLMLAGLKGQLSNSQSMTSLPSTTTVAGDTWKQAGLTGSEKGLQVKSIVLADYHAANQRIYIIIIADADTTFDQDQTTIFQPMLQSFKFV